MIRVCVLGLGKTGIEIARALMKQEDMHLVSVFCSPRSEKEGKQLEEIIGGEKTHISVTSTDNLIEVIKRTKPHIAIDFSTPKSTLENAKFLSALGVNMVVGTTGFLPTDIGKLARLARKNQTGILYAPNITTGVNVMMLMANLASTLLSDYDFQITEIHHKNKKDVPSGTAIKIADEIEKGLAAASVKKCANDIPTNSVRAGGVVGRHEVIIAGEHDKIEISHESFSRSAFALGAIRGARFLYGKKGYFEMRDALDLKSILTKYIESEKINSTKNILHSLDVDAKREAK